MEELLTCPICLDIFVEAHVITCGHSFCKSCIQGSEECPICRRGIKTTTLNFSLHHVATLYASEHTDSRMKSLEISDNVVRRNKSITSREVFIRVGTANYSVVLMNGQSYTLPELKKTITDQCNVTVPLLRKWVDVFGPNYRTEKDWILDWSKVDEYMSPNCRIYFHKDHHVQHGKEEEGQYIIGSQYEGLIGCAMRSSSSSLWTLRQVGRTHIGALKSFRLSKFFSMR